MKSPKNTLGRMLLVAASFGVGLAWPCPQVLSAQALPDENRANYVWPDAPAYSPATELLITRPEPVVPPNDLFKEATEDQSIRGNLVYVPLLFDQPASRWYFIMRSIGQEGLLQGKPTSIASYLTGGVNGHIFKPQFSADGQSLLFQMGDDDWQFGGHVVYLWNFKTKEVRTLIGPLLNRTIYWSPGNKYLAYFEGGDADGQWDEHITPPSLVIYNVATRDTHQVTPNPGVVNATWTHQETLLYSFQSKTPVEFPNPAPQLDRRGKPVPESQIFVATPLPNIYEVTDQGKPHIVIAGGQDPVASPDGRWIAFSGWSSEQQDYDAQPTPEHVAFQLQSEPSLYLYDRKQHKRRLLRQSLPRFMRWTPDSRHLVLGDVNTKESTPTATDNFVSQFEAKLSTIEVAEEGAPLATVKEVATLTAQHTRSYGLESFVPMKFSKDGRLFFLTIFEGNEKSDGTGVTMKLCAVDWQTGQTTIVARLENYDGRANGWDWHD